MRYYTIVRYSMSIMISGFKQIVPIACDLSLSALGPFLLTLYLLTSRLNWGGYRVVLLVYLISRYVLISYDKRKPL